MRIIRSSIDSRAMEKPDSEAPYPNAPVQEVVFEIRFPGEPAIECKRDLFFDRVRGEFPEVHVPTFQPGERQAVALMPYHFKSADRSRSILTALNLFAFASSRYLGFHAFRDEASRWLKEFAAFFKIGRLTRTGLRYINLIPLLPDSRASDLLKVKVALGDYPAASVRNLVLGLEIPRPAGVLNMRLAPWPDSKVSQLVLDFDYAKTENLSIANIEEYLDESHDETKRLFEGLLTDSYRTYLKGEAVE
jgi:uncharacterized protein (TIGR04255 family)